MRKRYNEQVENVDFEKLRKCLKDHGITQRELSIVCGYYPGYIEKNALRRNFLNTHVRDVLTYAYKIDPSEYTDAQPKYVCKIDPDEYIDIQSKEVTDTEDDDIYTLTFSCDGEFLKKLAIKSLEEHITVEDFMVKCILEGIGEKFLEENEK